MRRERYVIDLCAELEQKLFRQQISEDCLKRYRKVLKEFSVYGGENNYSQSLGTAFLVEKFGERGGLVTSDEQSTKEAYYFRCIRMLAEYFNFGIIHLRNDIQGEVIWPEGFRMCTEKFFETIIDEGLSYGYVSNARKVVMDLLLFLNAVEVYNPKDICTEHNDTFIRSYYWLSAKGIETKLCLLRRYYRYLYLNGFIEKPLAEMLPHASIQGRSKFPTVWNTEMIRQIESSAERVSPAGKRSYAMVMLAANLGLRIGDIRDLKLDDIDWKKKQISIVQNKTGKALLLPMPDNVGWAVIDYLKNGRPVTESSNVFVKHRPPYDGFPINSSLNHIFSSVLNKAGIPPEKREHTGWHTFRRSLATNLLQNNIEMTTISEILGHSDPNITGRYYVRLDVDALRKCALEVEVKDYVRK